MIQKSQLELYLEELDVPQASAGTLSQPAPSRTTSAILNVAFYLQIITGLSREFVKGLKEITVVCFYCMFLFLWLALPYRFQSSTVCNAILSAVSGQLKPQELIPLTVLCCSLVFVFIDLNRVGFTFGLHSLLWPVQYVLRHFVLAICLLSFSVLVASAFMSWKYREVLHRVEITLKYIRKLQSLTLGNGISSTLPTWQIVNHRNSSYSLNHEYTPISWSAWTSCGTMKRRLQIGVIQLEELLLDNKSPPIGDIKAYDVVKLMERTHRLLKNGEISLSLQISNMFANTSSFICACCALLLRLLTVLTALNHVGAVAESIISVTLSSTNDSESNETECLQSVDIAVHRLLPLQVAALRNARRCRSALEAALLAVTSTEWMIQRSIGNYRNDDDQHRHVQLRELAELQIILQSIGILDENTDRSGNPASLLISNSTLGMGLLDFSEAWKDLEHLWTSILLQKQLGTANHIENANNTKLRNNNELDSSRNDSRNTNEIMSLSSTQIPALEIFDDDTTNNNIDNAENVKNSDENIMEVFVATVSSLLQESTDQNSSSASVEQQQQKYLRLLTKSLVGELRQSLVEKHRISQVTSLTQSSSADDKLPRLHMQRVRDFDSSSVREERIEIPLLSQYVDAHQQFQIEESEDIRRRDMLMIQQSTLFAPEKQIMRNELHSVLGAIARSNPAQHQAHCLGDEIDEDDDM
jgi:hypothetical protein